MTDREAAGRRIAANPKNIRRDGGDWLVRSESGPRWYRVRYTASYDFICECPDHEHGNTCKHIHAVLYDRVRCGDTSPLIGPFEVERLNDELRHETTLQLVPYRFRGQEGWLLEPDPESLPLTEWYLDYQIIEPVGVVIDHAMKTKTRIFMRIDYTPYDYTGWVSPIREHERLGADKLAAMLVDMDFRSLGRYGSTQTLLFDPDRVPDPYAGVPIGEDLKEFIEEAEEAIDRLTGQNGSYGFYARQELLHFRLRKRKLLKAMRIQNERII